MNILITGASGNLGSRLARYLLDGPHTLKLLTHRRDLPFDVSSRSNTTVVRAGLGSPAGLQAVCHNVDCIVHLAGVLFAPRPERLLAANQLRGLRDGLWHAGAADA